MLDVHGKRVFDPLQVQVPSIPRLVARFHQRSKMSDRVRKWEVYCLRSHCGEDEERSPNG